MQSRAERNESIKMSKPTYRNHRWYIDAGWSAEPKERFKAVIPLIERHVGLSNLSILDVGCATGELLGLLNKSISNPVLTGVDYVEELLEAGRILLPEATFRFASAIDLPAEFNERFDVVTSIGCMSIFDTTEIDRYWRSLLGACRTGGVVIVLAPLNEYGVDMMTQHRKRMPGCDLVWETGWNIYSIETIRELLLGMGQNADTLAFQIPFAIAPDADPVKTWTTRVGDNDFQLTNGLKILINHYFVTVKKR
jgi:SAM-dependent methyltransferase